MGGEKYLVALEVGENWEALAFEAPQHRGKNNPKSPTNLA